MPSSLFFRGGSLSGFVSGFAVNCMFTLPQGSSPAPGEYFVHGPYSDPVYGDVVIMARGDAQPGSPGYSSNKYASGQLNSGALADGSFYGAPSNKVVGAPAFKMFSPSNKMAGAPTTKWDGASANKWAGALNNRLPGTTGSLKIGVPAVQSVFVLSSRVIPGTNSVLVTRGFSDLIQALQQAGGAEITVF